MLERPRVVSSAPLKQRMRLLSRRRPRRRMWTSLELHQPPDSSGMSEIRMSDKRILSESTVSDGSLPFNVTVRLRGDLPACCSFSKKQYAALEVVQTEKK